ncbi:DUF362 domain-containing protein [Sporohalobacter salinus]|uniref:DUF362 domain-containing protein n=1 Tax=Sporohalobacter salinus TaxID=1494606 RepID=UPI001960C393|nr:DUF362 domain-containing protein [Sporohalobacter salinus]MBM7623023.1 uncharacterized protein (DUF362 family)/Pyruvate/2-oxoacid:ferredoxin oxidoreductase delta subunit [Sporohalobacter salinus]
MSLVASNSCDRYEEDVVKEAVRKSVDELGGLDKFVSKDDQVLIKPNLLSPKAPKEAITTHPLVLKAVIELVQQLGAIPVVGESSGGFLVEESLTAQAFDKTGTRDVCQQLDVEMINFDRVATRKVVNPGSTVENFKLPLPVLEADFIISLPKLKTHGLTLFTGAVKNLYGVIPGMKKMEYHRRFPNPNQFMEVIVDILELVGADLAIMDGIIGLAGDGPGSSGIPCEVGSILASNDLVALDIVAASYLGYSDSQIKYLNLAAQRELGIAELNKIRTKGDFSQPEYKKYDLPSNVLLSYLPNFLLRLLSQVLMSKPVIDQQSCTQCKSCLDSCPQQAIVEQKNGEDNHLEIDESKCIKCLCCQEICPFDAIRLKENLLFKFLRYLG